MDLSDRDSESKCDWSKERLLFDKCLILIEFLRLRRPEDVSEDLSPGKTLTELIS